MALISNGSTIFDNGLWLLVLVETWCLLKS
jgi:hypothetical protein